MNSLMLAFIAVLLFYVGYRFYGRLIERLFDIDPDNETPAYSRADGRDYVPARNWLILFGHHFSSIAGAGPILGPVIAGMIWGWGPAVLWIVAGSILLGGVHDFSALMASVRHEGRSMGDVAESAIGYRAKLIFSCFVWLTLVLVIAVFASAAAKTLSITPQVVIPTFGLIGVAVLVGLMIYRWGMSTPLATAVGIACLFGLIVLGYHVPVNGSFKLWLYILIAYAFIASIIPVNILLQPRDYLAAFVLFFGLLFGYIGLVITHPTIHAPAFIGFSGEKGWLWPMMFVIIACGAISGFHSLVAGGTTSKQLPNERYAKRIGYGGMITEGVLAVLALIAVCAGLYWKGGPSGLVYPELMDKKGWISTFGRGYGELTGPMFGTLGALIGIMMLKTFIMTTLDTATRIARYVGEELFAEGLKLKFMRNPYINTTIIIAFVIWLSLGAWQAIWPIFGAANQLVAALALLIVSAWLLAGGKAIRYTIWPAFFMLATTVGALVWQIAHFIPQRKILLGAVGCVLLVLAAFMAVEAVRSLGKRGVTGSS